MGNMLLHSIFNVSRHHLCGYLVPYIPCNIAVTPLPAAIATRPSISALRRSAPYGTTINCTNRHFVQSYQPASVAW